ncbi:energy-coupling factor transporter transmembrane component T [Corynebacterium uberis]|uniref:energy-coupling factor transporter transmembrane component T n=1 Tax=Corynebacterium TaxID=1716 RepID=UPI001D0A55A7|nr:MULTISPECIES: energy-coupling factor transporter transmembrane component T [Corynebacterium]MCZ9309704.1 energy-coupling factor transporter transmembrane protein EcfT [Corynebacterium sp. c6VSa_13]UDL73508.1 energy-coupling factor transporter transmembrane protein EcfT [Corynebacterium uberis]UDL75612.1 energy-coupling factor transporter transmembrane protein EcfT [Corynebacterium uberis]UDL77825.1 energy-coupling factor transporter transmembrane protein EcfT [Corynebacterium uberis]UDL8010
MSTALALAQAGRPAPLRVDPRVALLTLVVLNALAMGRSALWLVLVCALLVAALLAASCRWRAAGTTAALALGFYGVAVGLPRLIDGAWVALVGAAAYWLCRFTVTVGVAWWLMVTVRPGQLVAALQSWHAPRWLVIPLAVIVRMVPVIVESSHAVADAMVLRGLRPTPVGVVAHPVRSAEITMIPLLSTIVRTTDELAASAMLRGLGGPWRATSLSVLRLRWVDAALAAVLVGLVVCRVCC